MCHIALRAITITPVSLLPPDTLSRIHVDATLHIPSKALSNRSRLIVRPRLLQGNSPISECPVMAFDAPIYSKKMERRIKLSGYSDPLADRSVKIDRKKEYSIPYTVTLPVPGTMDGGRIAAVLETDGCGNCYPFDTVDVAYISNLPTLIDLQGSLRLCWMEPKFVIAPKVLNGAGEALLQFRINRYDIDLSLGNNLNEMEQMLSTLLGVVSDTLVMLNRLDIYGMASADGSYAFNTTLARNRALAAKEWLVERTGMQHDLADKITTGSRPEGWRPVLEAMRADGHKDTSAVASILDRYDAENDDVAEHYIRRLACWNDIRTKYLQKDRKVEYEYTYTIRSFTTDQELIDAYAKRPDAFNEEKLLRVAALMPTLPEKRSVYEATLRRFPQSQVAANNLAILLLREGRTDEASALLNTLRNLSPEALNTKAAICVHRHDYKQAAALFKANKALPESQYNLGLLMANARKMESAYALMQDFGDTQTAIVALCCGHDEAAAAIMESCDDTTPLAEYVRALVSARKADGNALIDHLRSAVSKEDLRVRAEVEADFRPYATRTDFINLISQRERDE